MRKKRIQTILLFLALGFAGIWVLEFRRTSMAESYWLLLIVLTLLFWYQWYNLRGGNADNINTEKKSAKPDKSRKTSGKPKKKK